jgi:hypothetical protein
MSWGKIQIVVLGTVTTRVDLADVKGFETKQNEGPHPAGHTGKFDTTAPDFVEAVRLGDYARPHSAMYVYSTDFCGTTVTYVFDDVSFTADGHGVVSFTARRRMRI